MTRESLRDLFAGQDRETAMRKRDVLVRRIERL
jgi:hypothetical protein